MKRQRPCEHILIYMIKCIFSAEDSQENLFPSTAEFSRHLKNKTKKKCETGYRSKQTASVLSRCVHSLHFSAPSITARINFTLVTMMSTFHRKRRLEQKKKLNKKNSSRELRSCVSHSQNSPRARADRPQVGCWRWSSCLPSPLGRGWIFVQ